MSLIHERSIARRNRGPQDLDHPEAWAFERCGRFDSGRPGGTDPAGAFPVTQLPLPSQLTAVGTRILRALPRFRDQGRPFAAFAYGIAAHKVADAQRHGATQP